MPRKSRRSAIRYGKRSRRRASRPNVYVAPTRADEDSVEAVAAEEAAPATRPVRRSPRTRAPGPRGRHASLRGTIYTQYLRQELRKLGFMTLAIAVVLAVLTVALR